MKMESKEPINTIISTGYLSQNGLGQAWDTLGTQVPHYAAEKRSYPFENRWLAMKRSSRQLAELSRGTRFCQGLWISLKSSVRRDN